MSCFFLKNQSPSELHRLWQATPFIYHKFAKQNLTRWEIFQAAEQLSRTTFSFNHDAPAPPAILLFQQRQHFLIALLAIAMQQGQVILPPNLAETTLQKLKNEMPNLSVFGDSVPKELNSLQNISSKQIDDIIDHVKHNNEDFNLNKLEKNIESIQTSEIWLYTSGSTGKPKKVVKTWQNMMRSAELAIERFQLMQPCYIVATVPCQHMFGLETTIFWPFFSKASLWHERPIFPEDIISALSKNTNPFSLLVSTPLHLKKLLAFELNWPSHLKRVLSATAPLSKTLAKHIEKHLNVSVFEVYGSTETASIASRETTRTDIWKTYKHVDFQQHSTSYSVKAPGLTDFENLNDQIKCLDANHFTLGKRDSDLIKIAGKRTSLTELNQLLQSIPGITEGVFIQPPATERLAAFVVSSLSKSDILTELRKSIDPVFLPRPITYLKKLPRSEVGKVLYNDLLDKLSN